MKLAQLFELFHRFGTESTSLGGLAGPGRAQPAEELPPPPRCCASFESWCFLAAKAAPPIAAARRLRWRLSRPIVTSSLTGMARFGPFRATCSLVATLGGGDAAGSAPRGLASIVIGMRQTGAAGSIDSVRSPAEGECNGTAGLPGSGRGPQQVRQKLGPGAPRGRGAEARFRSKTDGRGWFRTTDLSRVKRALSH